MRQLLRQPAKPLRGILELLKTRSPAIEINASLKGSIVYLMRVHAALVADADGLEIAESGVNREKRGIAIELEDDGQRLAQLEIDGMLVARDVNRRDREKSSAEDCGTHIWNFRSER